MSSESQLVLDVWEAVRDHLPHGKRPAIAEDLLYAFSEFGFEAGDLASIVDEDPDLTTAYEEVFPGLEDEEEADE